MNTYIIHGTSRNETFEVDAKRFRVDERGSVYFYDEEDKFIALFNSFEYIYKED